MRPSALGAVSLILLTGITRPLQAQSSESPLHLSALAVNGTAASGDSIPVDIEIRRWTPTETRARLIDTWLSQGTNALFAFLQRSVSHGNLSIAASPADHTPKHVHPIQYAWKLEQPDGSRRIVLVTERSVGWEDAKHQSQSMAYPFALFEIHLTPDGRGEGRLAVVSEISCNKDTKTIELERYNAEAVRLADVRISNADGQAGSE
jgi:hypothetical protein